MSAELSRTGHSGHSRSHSRQKALPRRSTQGPLEADDDPLGAIAVQNTDVVRPVDTAKSRVSTSSRRDSQSPAPSVSVVDRPRKDFSFLQRREIFQPLQQLSIPESFKRADAELDRANTSLSTLLSTGRFRNAAILSVELLISKADPHDHEHIFTLFYIRLVCLQLLGLHTFASQEVKALQDLGGSFYRDPLDESHIVPWELRVLAVRLQALGFGDWRRGIMGYYELGREARQEARKGSSEDQTTWRERLQDLGVKVASALVEMGDIEGAVRHLKSLQVSDDQKETMTLRIALLYLRAGDLHAAQHHLATGIEDNANTGHQEMVSALCKMAEGDYQAAITQLEDVERAWNDSSRDTALVRQNIAVCLVYCGRVSEARSILEELTGDDGSNRGMLFNLCTVYELCSDKSRDLKLDLSRETASQKFTSLGWEKANVDYKL